MSNAVNPFGTLDFVVFSALLAVSAVTGVYHALVKGGQRTTSRYLLADRGMHGLPVAMSMAVSFLSPITVLGGPAEIYHHGITYIFHAFSCLWIFPVACALFVPVFYDLKVRTSYEYLELRFNYPLRLMASALFVLQQAFYMALCLLGPALAFEAVQNFDMWKTLTITGVVCTFYTVLGGLKAVIWVDVFQFLVMLAAVVTFLVIGTVKAGGPEFVWNYNAAHGRLDINFSFDPTTRMTMLNSLFGTGMLFLSFQVGQTSVQRYAATNSMKQAKLTALMNIPFWMLFQLFFNFLGLVLFAFYNDIPSVLQPGIIINATLPTDVLANASVVLGEIQPRYSPDYSSPDQILVYFVSTQLGRIPGIQGLFIACVTAGTLSSVSSSINAMTAVTLEDFIKPFRRWRARRKAGGQTEADLQRDATDTLLSKILSCVYGVAGIGLSLLSSTMGTLITAAVILMGIVGGPMMAPFLTGMLYRRANSRGMVLGTIVGFALGLWLAVGSRVYRDVLDQVSPVYSLSSMWYTAFTCAVAMAVGILGSEVFRLIYRGERRAVVNPSLLATCLRPKGWHRSSAHIIPVALASDKQSEVGKEGTLKPPEAETFL